MTDLLNSPWIAVLLLAVLSLEAVILSIIWRKKHMGLPPMHIVSFLGAGAAFAIALGFALNGSSPLAMSVSLMAAFVFHLTDLLLRWQKQS